MKNIYLASDSELLSEFYSPEAITGMRVRGMRTARDIFRLTACSALGLSGLTEIVFDGPKAHIESLASLCIAGVTGLVARNYSNEIQKLETPNLQVME